VLFSVPASVHASWDAYFKTGEFATPGGPVISSGSAGGEAGDTAKTLHLINSYQRRGHEVANLDPLALNPKEPLLDMLPSTYGFTDADIDR
jgi:2-oxoglutarate dehydrogenase E1 component